MPLREYVPVCLCCSILQICYVCANRMRSTCACRKRSSGVSSFGQVWVPIVFQPLLLQPLSCYGFCSTTSVLAENVHTRPRQTAEVVASVFRKNRYVRMERHPCVPAQYAQHAVIASGISACKKISLCACAARGTENTTMPLREYVPVCLCNTSTRSWLKDSMNAAAFC